MSVFMLAGAVAWLNKQAGLNKVGLRKAALEAAEGGHEANLGGNLYKKRIASVVAKGKSGGSRAIITFRKGSNVFVMYGFAKKDRDNISDKGLKILKQRAKLWLDMPPEKIEIALKAELLIKL